MGSWFQGIRIYHSRDLRQLAAGGAEGNSCAGSSNPTGKVEVGIWRILTITGRGTCLWYIYTHYRVEK